jgi:hypothetical protein
MANVYYNSLDPAQKQIRLLRIIKDDPITCVLATFSLSRCPKYEALSYVWGSDTMRHAILLNGLKFEILHNVCLFLNHAINGVIHPVGSGDPFPGEKGSSLPVYCPNYLWIDRICIDQGNNVEKSHQVKLMEEIYRSSHRVVAWLGEAADDVNSGWN